MEITASEFKRDCLRIVAQVESTQVPIRVTRRGKVVVRLVPMQEREQPSLRDSVSYTNESELLAPVDESWEVDL